MFVSLSTVNVKKKKKKDLVPKGAQMGGRTFDCQSNPFEALCLVVALCVRS